MNESKQNKIVLLRQIIENVERNIIAAKQIISQIDDVAQKKEIDPRVSQIIEGTFDGEKMIGLDGKKYPIPVNYASKSKLIDGDLLKLTITEEGSFVYKQISPAERRKIIGTIIKDDNDKYYALSEGRKYKVLLASLTYFKAEEGDEVTLIVPKDKISKWAAIEAVMEELEDSKNDKKENAEIAETGNNELIETKDSQEGNIKQEKQYNNELIEDEWTPDIETMKKEAQFDKNYDDEISDDLL